jgi:hypothetical protein
MKITKKIDVTITTKSKNLCHSDCEWLNIRSEIQRHLCILFGHEELDYSSCSTWRCEQCIKTFGKGGANG